MKYIITQQTPKLLNEDTSREQDKIIDFNLKLSQIAEELKIQFPKKKSKLNK